MAKPAKNKGQRHRAEPDPVAAKIGARVRTLRQETAFTFDAFVEEIGLGRGYLSELERGLVVPSAVALAKIASALEVTVADVVLGDTLREQLFDVTRHLDASAVRQLLASANRKRRGAKPDE